MRQHSTEKSIFTTTHTVMVARSRSSEAAERRMLVDSERVLQCYFSYSYSYCFPVLYFYFS